MILTTHFIQKATAVATIIFVSWSAPTINSSLLAQAADVEVKGATVDCENINTKVTTPSPKVSLPNPSKLVPNVGKLLRKGVGVPAPDSNAPDVKVPKVSTKPQSATCEPKDKR